MERAPFISIGAMSNPWDVLSHRKSDSGLLWNRLIHRAAIIKFLAMRLLYFAKPSRTEVPMNEAFAALVSGLHPEFERLMSMSPFRSGVFPASVAKQGVYLLSEGDAHLLRRTGLSGADLRRESDTGNRLVRVYANLRTNPQPSPDAGFR
jgi:hypothetical protein